MWFDNLPMFTELQGFHYSQKNTKCGSTIFFFLENDNNKTLISKITVFTS